LSPKQQVPCFAQWLQVRDFLFLREQALASSSAAPASSYTIEMLRDTVYPAALQLFAPEIAVGQEIWHQTDNALAHVAKTTKDFKAQMAATSAIKVHPNQQAPRCPESNVNKEFFIVVLQIGPER
jgi:hypothetical protein